MLELTKISLARGKKVLLNEASARIEHRYRVGLIGRNGTGKSSLLKMLMGELAEDSGHINLMVDSSDIAYLEQSLPHTDKSAIEYTKGGDAAWLETTQQLAQAEQDHDGLAIAECHARLQEIDGYSIESRAAIILSGLGFTDDELEKPVSDFSGGWQMRLQLARVLLSRAHFLMLDEPTNHLDINAIMWLENCLNTTSTTLLLISHDRDFLDNVCTHTLHLSQTKLRLYQGNYTAFTRQYSLQLEVESREREKISAQRAHLQKFVDKFRAKASKAKQAQSRVKALEKLVMAPGLQQENSFHFEFLPSVAIQGSMLNFDGSAGYGQTEILQRCRLNIDYGDRIGLIGANGQGKTTLLKTLAGELALIKGNIHRHSKARLGYFSQQQLEMLDPLSTPMDSLMTSDKSLSSSGARNFLGRFNFSGERVFDLIENFSGGEKARLALAMLIYKRPNLLLLDEPTNHLDIQMREAFILALQNFTGSVVLVSHDRHFVASVVDEIWCVANAKVKRLGGDLDDYKNGILGIEKRLPESLSSSNTTSSTTPSSPTTQSKKIDHKLIKRLESRINKITLKIAELEAELADSSLYLAKNREQLHQRVMAHKEAKDKLQALEAQWLDAQD